MVIYFIGNLILGCAFHYPERPLPHVICLNFNENCYIFKSTLMSIGFLLYLVLLYPLTVTVPKMSVKEHLYAKYCQWTMYVLQLTVNNGHVIRLIMFVLLLSHFYQHTIRCITFINVATAKYTRKIFVFVFINLFLRTLFWFF